MLILALGLHTGKPHAQQPNAAEYMHNYDIIDDLLQQLIAHRKTLQTFLTQQARAGSATALPAIIGGIDDARAEIRRLKSDLRHYGHPVDDHPNDDNPNDAAIQRLRAETRAARLRDLCHNHADFITDRLGSFVGRAAELTEICQQIAATQPAGGYVTITGQAGQGKSSIIARLVHDAGPATVAHHFIPFTPRPDHQVGLLRDIMAQLILKHDLPDHYIAAESRPALRDYFATLVRTLSESGHAEVIYIDGLDQLQEDLSGLRDLSFLPTNPPPGIVFVLGTRPNDTLKPLELLKPYNEYPLPNLSRADFDLILQHRGAALPADLADRFYATMQENALYLDLVAREIHTAGVDRVEAIIARVASNPNNLFSLTIDRLKLQRQLWRELIKPILGVLLATQAALALRAIRALIDQDEDATRDGLQRLGGLVARDGAGRYALYHLKLRDYLRYDPKQPTKDYIFAPDEEETYHQKFITWCEGGRGGLTSIWRDIATDSTENDRRSYAREHYITHLAMAHNWEELWSVIDAGGYGHAKLLHDPSTRGYVQDLDRARQAAIAAADELVEPVDVTLPRLWRYSLLRGRLASQADNYPNILLIVLAQVGRGQESIGLTELLSDQERKATVLCHIGFTLNEIGASGGEIVIARAITIARALENSWLRTKAVRAVVEVLVEFGALEDAATIARTIELTFDCAWALHTVARAQAQAGQLAIAVTLCDEATVIARKVEDAFQRSQALSAVATAQAEARQLDAAAILCDEASAAARTIEEEYNRALAFGTIAEAQAEAGLWDLAISTVYTIEHIPLRAASLSAVAVVQAQAGQLQEATALCLEALALTRTIVDAEARAQALLAVAEAQAKVGQWDEAIITAHSSELTSYLAWALRAVTEAQAQAGLWDAALTTAGSIKDISYRSQALCKLADAQAQAGLWDAAITTADTIEQPFYRSQALSVVAKAQAEAGQLDTATVLCDEASAAARTIEDASTRALAFSKIAEAQAEAGLWDVAITTTHILEDVSSRAAALSAVAVVQAQAGQLQEATALCLEALALTRTIVDAEARAQALLAVAETQAKVGQLDEAIITTYTIENAFTRAESLSKVADAQAQAGLWDAALTTAGSIEHVFYRSQALSKVADAQAQAGLWDAAITTADTIEQPFYRSQALSVVAKAQAKAELWDTAAITARLLKSDLARVTALSAIAKTHLPSQTVAATALCNEAALIATTIVDTRHRAWALRAVVEALAATGLWDTAIDTAQTIEFPSIQEWALQEVAEAQAQAGMCIAASATAYTIQDSNLRSQSLRSIAQALTRLGNTEQLRLHAQNSWLQATTSNDVWSLLPLANNFIIASPTLLSELLSSMRWVTDFLHSQPRSAQ